MKAPYISAASIAFIAVLLAVPAAAFASPGDIITTVTREFGGATAGMTVAYSCPGGTYSALATTTDSSGIASTSSTTVPAGANCSNGNGIDIRVSKAGYITTTLASTSSGYTFSTAAANNYAVTGVQYGLKVTVADELGNSLTPTTTATFRGTATTSANGATLYWADTAGAGGALYIPYYGYVLASSTNAGLGNITTGTGAQVAIALGNNAACSTVPVSASASCKGLQFGLKVIAADQFGNTVVPLTTTQFRGNATSTSNGATLYWADTAGAGGVLSLRALGYIFATTTNPGFASVTTGSTSQNVITLGNNAACSTSVTTSSSCEGFQPTLKVLSFQNELGSDVTPTNANGTPFTSGANLTIVKQILSGGLWYLAASSTVNAGDTLTASSTGYVSKTSGNIVTSEAAQQTIDIGGSNGATYSVAGLPFALKITVTAPGTNGAAYVSVTAGNSGSVSCAENGTTATYYCVIPTSDTGTTVTASKSGYVTNTATYAARTNYTDAQSTASVALSTTGANLGVGGGGGGGSSGGGGSITYAPQTVAAVSIVPGCPSGFACAKVSLSSRPVPGVSAVFSAPIASGQSSESVTRLQKLLASDPTIYPEGKVTGHFGPLTLKAVQAFQARYGVAKQGDSGYGTVGPKTRAMLQKVFGGQ